MSRAALVIAVLALVVSTTGLADAAREATTSQTKQGKVVRLTKANKIATKFLPKVPRATRADNIGGQTEEELTTSCEPTTVDLGTYCMSAAVFPVANEQLGQNDYFFASKACTEAGGYLPTAAQLIGSAERVKLNSVITDSQLTASIDLDATDGLKDRREMSSTLITTAAGSSAAGTQGVSEGSKGDPRQGEPDPTPLPANPAPETLQYVTVYDNQDKGGFAGARSVAQPEAFRCAFNKVEGAAQKEEEGGTGGDDQAGAEAGSGSASSAAGSGKGSGKKR